MIDEHAQTTQLYPCLTKLDFSRRYYAFCDEHNGQTASVAVERAEIETLLGATGLSFAYRSREKFFQHVERAPSAEFTLNLAITPKHVEAIVYVTAGTASMGGPFQVLAANLAKLQYPSWSRDPPYPRLPYANREGLAGALAFAVELYREVRACQDASGSPPI